MRKYILDTHTLLFLIYKPKMLSKKAIKIIEDDSNILLIPNMAILEAQYLIEIGKIKGNVSDIIHYIKQKINTDMIEFSEIHLNQALNLSQTRDPFDRIILATAMSLNVSIITRDNWMENVYNKTIW